MPAAISVCWFAFILLELLSQEFDYHAGQLVWIALTTEEVVLDLIDIVRQNPGLGKDLEIFGKHLFHSVELTGELVLLCEEI